LKLDDRPKQTTWNEFWVGIALGWVQTKASLVGFIACNGLNGLSESQLFKTQVNLNFKV